MHNFSRYEAIRRRREAEGHMRSSDAETGEKIAAIAAHPETKIIKRQDLSSPWEYVEDLFPRIAPAIARTNIFKNENTAFCKNIGIPSEAGGIFLIRASTILICWNEDRFKDDVVVCHEMLHYASQLLGGSMKSVDAEENFAFSKSINYLISRGYTKEWIRDEYMLPYYWSREYRNDPSLGKEDAKTKAMNICDGIIAQEMYGIRYEQDCGCEDRFDTI